jgi:carbon monoxide dehydrogenase subunit G
MPTITVEQSIRATPERVFDLSTNVHEWADMVPAITRVEVLTDGPVGLGTRFRETRTMFGKQATEEMEFVEFERPRRYALGAESHGCRYHTSFDVVPEGDGCRLVMSFSGEPQTLAAKLMAVVMKPMMRKMADLCAKDLAAVKARAEAG